jgi:hypothetical protein
MQSGDVPILVCTDACWKAANHRDCWINATDPAAGRRGFATFTARTTMKKNRTLSVLAMLAAASAIAASANAQGYLPSNVGDFHPSVTVLNQKLKGDAVKITYAFLPKDGTLAIFSGDPANKASASVVGSVDLQAGDHREIKVPLTGEPKSGTQLWAMVEQGKSGKPFANADERAEQSFKTL